MGALHTYGRMLDATRPDPFAPIASINVRCREPDSRLAHLHGLKRPWTPEEWAYAESCERLVDELEDRV